MASILAWAERPVPRPFLVFGLPVAFLLLTLFFCLVLFPYERIADSLSGEIEAATGMRVRVEDLSPALSLLGPGFEATDVTLTPPRERPVELDHVFARPAWSTSWFRLDPAIYMETEGAKGSISGVVIVGSKSGFHGTVDGLDLGLVPIDRFLNGAAVQGTLTADSALDVGEEGPDGELQFVVIDGSLTIPGSPIGLPFETLSGALTFGGDNAMTVERLELEGPMVSGVATGQVGASERGFSAGPLQLTVDVQVNDDIARSAMRGMGVRLGKDGSSEFNVSGTLSRPVVR